MLEAEPIVPIPLDQGRVSTSSAVDDAAAMPSTSSNQLEKYVEIMDEFNELMLHLV